MFLSASAVPIMFKTEQERKEFLLETQVVGIYNEATISFDCRTGQFWSILKTKRYHITRSEVTKMGLTTKGCRKA